jgi:hypothetical protein
VPVRARRPRAENENGEDYSMRIFISLTIIVFIGLSAQNLAQAQPANSCKQCGDQRRACTSGYSGKTCQTEYERCMKNCQHK